jgi:hypothetical protein
LLSKIFAGGMKILDAWRMVNNKFSVYPQFIYCIFVYGSIKQIAIFLCGIIPNAFLAYFPYFEKMIVGL